MDFASALANLKRSAEQTSNDGDSNKRPRQSNDRYNNNNTSALGRALMTLPHYRSSTPSDTNTRHICLLFITIDDLPFEDLWKEWTLSANELDVTVSMIVHAKFPTKVKSEFVRKRLLVEPPKLGRGREYAPPTYHSRRPEWGSIEITRAMLDLLFEGLKIGRSENGESDDERFSTNRYRVAGGDDSTRSLPPVDKFIFCSETCIPVTTLKEAASVLFNNKNVSWVNGRSTPNNGYSRQMQFEKVSQDIPKNCIYKADQWMLLSRPHAVAVMEIDRNLPRGRYLWQCFTQTKASDEMYFPTALSLLAIMPSSPELERRRITYADWSESARNPASFSHGVEDFRRVAAMARREGCLFARKFTLWDVNNKQNATNKNGEDVPPGRITVEEWKECMNERDEKTDVKSKATDDVAAQDGGKEAVASSEA